MSTPSLIRDYEDELTSTIDSVRREITALRATLPSAAGGPSNDSMGSPGGAKAEGGGASSSSPAPSAADRPAMNRRITASLRRLRDVLANLEIESAQAAPEVRAEVKGRLMGYKASVNAIDKDATALKKLSADADREELLRNTKSTAQKSRDAAAGGGGDTDETRAMKQQLARTTATMKRGSSALRDAERLTYEMNETADSTLTELERQRATIRGIGDTVRATDEELSHVQRILRKMHREMLKNKLMLSGIIALLLIMIIGILYYQFARPSASHSHEAAGVSGGDGGGVAPSHDVPTLAPSPTGWMPSVPTIASDTTTMPPVDPPPPVTTAAAVSGSRR